MPASFEGSTMYELHPRALVWKNYFFFRQSPKQAASISALDAVCGNPANQEETEESERVPTNDFLLPESFMWRL